MKKLFKGYAIVNEKGSPKRSLNGTWHIAETENELFKFQRPGVFDKIIKIEIIQKKGE